MEFVGVCASCQGCLGSIDVWHFVLAIDLGTFALCPGLGGRLSLTDSPVREVSERDDHLLREIRGDFFWANGHASRDRSRGRRRDSCGSCHVGVAVAD